MSIINGIFKQDEYEKKRRRLGMTRQTSFYEKSIFFLFFLFSFSSYSLPVIPDEINIPVRLEKRTANQIKAVFSSLEKQHKNKTANLWKLKYQKAFLLKKKHTDSFCRLMKELAEAPAFPLRQLALIQSYEICPYPEEPVFRPESFPEWLRFRLAKAFYKRRKFFDNPENTLSTTIYLAKHSPYKDLRISYLKHALSLVKEQGNKKVEEELKTLLYKEAPRLKPNPNSGDYFSIAEDLRQNRRFQQAKVFYVKVLNATSSSFDEKNLSFQALGRIYRIQKDRKKKIVNSKQWSEWLLKENTEQSLSMYYKQKLSLARQQWNLDKNQQAIATITNILKEPQSKWILNEALYLRGLIYSQENRPELSLKDWDQAVKNLRKQRSQNKLLEKVLWKRAWLFRNQRNYRKAFNDLKMLKKISNRSYIHHKTLFWKAKSLQSLGQKAVSKRYLRELVKKDHFGYYGLLARKMLNKKPPFPEKEVSVEQSLFKEKKEENLIHWLILFKESELLSHFLDKQEKFLLEPNNQTEENWLKMISLWIKAKKYLKAFQSLQNMDESFKNNFLKKYVYLLYPLDFVEEVEDMSQRWSLSKALILAVIRQESAFDVRARSTADAFGLMQLIPSTARQTARKFKVSYRNFRDLYRPSKNIFLGTAYLQGLLKKYDNNVVLAVCAYNAGETPVNQWHEKRKDMDVLEFIENIPYEETRSYVRLILRNYIFYHNKLGVGESWFPEEILQ